MPLVVWIVMRRYSMKLSDNDRRKIGELIEEIATLVDVIKEPINPRVESYMMMAIDELIEQIELDKYYDWSEISEESPEKGGGGTAVVDDVIPSPDDLCKWMENPMNNEEDEDESE